MRSAPVPQNEPERLQSLKAHSLLDTLPEDVYDGITKIASEICGTPISLLTLVDEDRQWFKSKQGLEVAETPREISFCAHAIVGQDEAFVVNDARYDERFHDNPLTTGEPQVVFYAGVPVRDAHGLALGTLCVIDHRPRELTEDKIHALKALAKLVNAHFELRKVNMDLDQNAQKLSGVKEAAATLLHSVEALEASGFEDKNRYLMNIKEAAKGLMQIEK